MVYMVGKIAHSACEGMYDWGDGLYALLVKQQPHDTHGSLQSFSWPKNEQKIPEGCDGHEVVPCVAQAKRFGSI